MLLKEDYADDRELDEEEKIVLAKTVSSILSPVSDSLDYMFYITIPENTETTQKTLVYFFFRTTNFEREDLGLPNKSFIYSFNKEKPHLNYLCATEDFDGFFAKLTRLLSNIGPTSQASAAVNFVQVDEDGSLSDAEAQVDLVLWDAVWLGTTSERTAGLFYGEDPEQNYWGCTEIDIDEPQAFT